MTFQVTFPITQDQIVAERKRISARLQELRMEEKALVAILTALRSMCLHPKSTRYGCNDCGADWGD